MSHLAYKQMLSSRQALEDSLVSSGGEGILLTKPRLDILNQKPLQLLKNLREGKLSAVAVLESYQAKVMKNS